jgi:TRAP-type mannitol/chloroaromatic compound transport system permease small subunit
MDVFALIGGPKQIPLYALLAPLPIVVWVFRAEFKDAVRRTPNASTGERILYLVDSLSTAIGKTYGWAILVLTFTTSYEVFSRYMFGAPTDWAFDASYMLYGSLFMLGGAYALARNSHVRGDFIYRAWSPRTQAGVDFTLFILFFFPGMLAFVYSGYGFAEVSRWMNEHSAASPDGPIVWPFKWLISIVGCLMVIQGIVELTRCVMTMRTGEWPQRLHDVEELEKVMIEKAEHGEYKVIQELEKLGQKKGSV